MSLYSNLYLYFQVGPIIQKKKKNTIMRNVIPAAIKLQIMLRYLASGDSLSSLQYLYRVPKKYC